MTIAGGLAASGCGSTRMTHTPRTATEQLLLTSAWDDAVKRIDFSPLSGVPVHLDTTNLKGHSDEGWIASSLRQALLTHGALLRTKPEEARWIVEPRVGVYGTDSSDWMIGLPQLTIPITIPGLPMGTIPEVPIYKKSHQRGVARLALFAYDRQSGQVVWTSGTVTADADNRNTHLGAIGPIQSGTLHRRDESGYLPAMPGLTTQGGVHFDEPPALIVPAVPPPPLPPPPLPLEAAPEPDPMAAPLGLPPRILGDGMDLKK
ncbi:DUF6655 family protein [Isosphaera pallida]|nr:DUF6655 family protein [Isosphaera pallida]